MDMALEVRGLRKAYPGFLLDDISLEVPAGSVMGLVGPNGAGKTTLIKLILDLVRRDSGTIRLLGLDPVGHGTVRRRIGVVHEMPRYPHHLTLAEIGSTIAPFYPTWDERAFRRHLQAFDLSPRQRFGRLSRGMKTRFVLAAALSHHAELLLLDEPTSGLDPVFRRRLLDVLRGELQDEKTTLLFSTHITGDLDHLADYVSVLIAGRVILSERMDEVSASWGVVRGTPESLPRLRGVLRGIRETAVGFDAVTNDAPRVRKAGGDAVVVERASVEDILVHLAREEKMSGEMVNADRRTSTMERRNTEGTHRDDAGLESDVVSSRRTGGAL
ncbi:MAG: ABC transporter ATP-binding protein [Candidatus Eisenbacteria bacterium]|jgi:ABC-2 type transport system ATP-binding protein|nr:ABC transporter ATP-binding protein [Candidatus Eisenbacteria bacterium]